MAQCTMAQLVKTLEDDRNTLVLFEGFAASFKDSARAVFKHATDSLKRDTRRGTGIQDSAELFVKVAGAELFLLMATRPDLLGMAERLAAGDAAAGERLLTACQREPQIAETVPRFAALCKLAVDF